MLTSHTATAVVSMSERADLLHKSELRERFAHDKRVEYRFIRHVSGWRISGSRTLAEVAVDAGGGGMATAAAVAAAA